jgi:hypothetical protein
MNVGDDQSDCVSDQSLDGPDERGWSGHIPRFYVSELKGYIILINRIVVRMDPVDTAIVGRWFFVKALVDDLILVAPVIIARVIFVIIRPHFIAILVSIVRIDGKDVEAKSLAITAFDWGSTRIHNVFPLRLRIPATRCDSCRTLRCNAGSGRLLTTVAAGTHPCCRQVGRIRSQCRPVRRS